MTQYSYTRPNRLSRLHAELLAAGVIPQRVEGNDTFVRITVPDTVSKASVDAVVAAHDSAKYDQEEQQQKQQRDTDLAVLRQYLTAATANPVLVALIRRALGE